MLRSTRGLTALGLASALATPVLASDQETFNKLIAKYAATATNPKPKAACACTEFDPPKPGFVEVLNFGSGDQVFCILPQFDANGHMTGSGFCTHFEVLAK
jgi:hypothetical protein